MLKRAAALAVATVLIPLLGGCGGDDAPDSAERQTGEYRTLGGGPPGGVVVVLLEGEPDELNPLTYSSLPAYQAVHLLFRSLARRDTTLSGYRPDLALSWELRPDSTVVLRLRPDVRWHDGRPVTAEDVVFTIEMQKDERTASSRQADVAAVREVRAIDTLTVEVRLARTGMYTVNALLEVVPVPKHLLGDVPPERMKAAPFGRSPVGNGFYRFGRWDSGQNLILEVNADAPEGRPALERIVMRFVPDINVAISEMLAGQGDLLPKVPPDQKSRIEAARHVELYHGPRVRPVWIAWNTARPPMDDPRVRRAVLMATDRERIAEGLFGDEGEPAFSLIPPALREHSSEVSPIPYDPQGARRLLAEAGWRDADGDGVREKDGSVLRIEIDYISAEQSRQDVLVAMQSMLRQVGVELVPRGYERTAWVDRLRNQEFVGSFWGWGWGPGVMGPNAEMILHSRSIPPNGPNFAAFSDSIVDALIDSTLVVTDTAVARGLWRRLEQRTIDLAPYAPIFLDPELFAVHQRYRNVRFRGIEWWEDVIYWYVPEEERLPRDQVG
jgi:peptide/nickel transport system substrate-binding protein